MSLLEMSDALFPSTSALPPFTVSTCFALFHRASMEHTTPKRSVAEDELSALRTTRPAVTDSISDVGGIQIVVRPVFVV